MKVKRQQQEAAVRSLYDNADTKSVKAVTKELFTTLKRELEDSRRVISDAKFLARSTDFPTADPLREAVAKVVENSAFLFELVFKLPDYADIWCVLTAPALSRTDFYRLFEHFRYQQFNLKPLVEWSYEFATKMGLYDDETFALFEKGAQELLLIPRAANYNNEHRRAERRRVAQEQADEAYRTSQAKKADAKKAEAKKAKASKSEL